uniref:Methyl-CpG binding domain protein 1 n=1 Tax=Taeniopygia guttata TaxID=59729 RepID=A0A674HCX2_TAEGU
MGTPPRRMAEGWAECPALGPGWQRREAFRKSGATSGRSDTYYRSPTGQKFRSKIELRRFLGPGHDLSNFDFKSGLERPGPTRPRKSPKWHQPAGPLPEPPKIFKKEEEEEEVEVEVEVGGAETEKAPPSPVQAPPIAVQTTPPALQDTPPLIDATPPSAVATPPPEPPHRRTRKRPPLEPTQDGVVALCAGCQSLFPGVSLPPQRRCRWLCPECRGELRPQRPPPHPLHAPPRSLSPSPTFLSSLRAFSVLFSSSFSFYPCPSFPGVFPLHHHHHHSSNCSNPVIIILFPWNFLFLLLFPDSSLPPFPSLLDHFGGEWSLKKFGSGVRGDPRKAGVTLTPFLHLPQPRDETSTGSSDSTRYPNPSGGGKWCPWAFPRSLRGFGGPPQSPDTPSPQRVGCGTCQACRIPEDCGICSACARNPPGGPSGPGRTPKCLLRRCLPVSPQGLGCGSCSGCLSTEDCGSCCICLRRLQPGLKRQWRCLRRRCLRPKKARVAKKPQSARPLTEKWKPLVEREPGDASSARHRKPLTKGKEKKKPGRPPKAPGPRGRGARSRASRRCGACTACRRLADCGRCDFCRDKPKFGGQNLKRQKCRWRQCLRCAMEKQEPLGGAENSPGPIPGPPLRLCPIKEEAGPLPRLEDPRLGLLIASAPRLKGAPPEPSVAPQRPSPGDLGVLIAATPRVKQEQPQPSASLVPVPPQPPPAQLVVLDESEEEEEEEEEEEGGSRVPFPLPPAPQLWPGSFLEELAEIPLPAHWGVVGADGGPGPCPARGLRLVQRCPRSSMAAAAVLLNPGLAFRVLVARGRPVPPGHEVLARRPPLRSVLDLVELLCDLEAYGPCPGPPGPPARPPAPRCHVLVRGGRCCRPCQMLGGEGH